MALPYGYKQVEYIESTGTQCINTEIIPVTNIRIEVDFLLTASQSTGGIVSAELTWTSNMCSIDAWAYRYGTGYKTHTLTANKRYAVVLDNGVFTENGTSVFTASGSVNTSIPLTIFAVNRGDSQNEFAKARLYSAKITTNGVVVRNFIPCINPYGVPGLYDTVSGRFFGNIGSGTLLHGEIVSTIIPGITPFIAGAYRNVPEGYVRVDGVWRPIVEIFTNVKGVWYSNIAKQVIYTWKKYNTVTTTKDGWAWSTRRYAVATKSSDASVNAYNDNRTPTFDVTYSNGKISKMTTSTYGMETRTAQEIYDGSFEYLQFINPRDWFVGGLIPKENLWYKSEGSKSSYGDTLEIRVYEPEYSPTTTYSQGSYIADVTAETADAYPTNGRHTDGYWYVFQG